MKKVSHRDIALAKRLGCEDELDGIPTAATNEVPDTDEPPRSDDESAHDDSEVFHLMKKAVESLSNVGGAAASESDEKRPRTSAR